MHFKHKDGDKFPDGFDPMGGFVTLEDGTIVQVLDEHGERDEVAMKAEIDEVLASNG